MILPALVVPDVAQAGQDLETGVVRHWLKAEGDMVKRDEPLVEVVTDKVNAEIPSPFEGKLVKISAAEGETVRVGAIIGQIETAGAAGASGRNRFPGTSDSSRFAPRAGPSRRPRRARS